ncbi:MAG: TolC family protein [Myxococcales bacterium]|nr:TolC family protein [Myxococcales bacterium]
MLSRTILGSCLVGLLWATQASAEESQTTAELAVLVKQAQKNPLATAAHERTRAAIAQEDEALASRWATLQGTAFVAPSPRIRCDNADCTQTSPQNVTINIAGLFAGLNLNIAQPLYTGGKLHHARRAAHAASKASKALEEDLSGRVAVLVAEAYYGLLIAQEMLWMLEDGSEHIESGRKTLEQKLEAGSPDATVQDRFRIQTLQSEVQAQIADASHGKTIALASLRALTGDPTITPKGGLLEPLAFDLPESHSGVVDPRLRAAQQSVEAHRALEGFEKGSFLPELAIVGGVNVARAQGVDNPPGAFAKDPFNTTSAYVALAARWQFAPLIQAARVRQRRAKKREAIATMEAAQRLSELDNTKALAKARLAQDRLKALKQGERATKAWVASVLQADAIGAASARELADAYLAHFASRAHMLESTYEWNLAVMDLRRQAGEFAPTP